jgi:hypothetical protein
MVRFAVCATYGDCTVIGTSPPKRKHRSGGVQAVRAFSLREGSEIVSLVADDTLSADVAFNIVCAPAAPEPIMHPTAATDTVNAVNVTLTRTQRNLDSMVTSACGHRTDLTGQHIKRPASKCCLQLLQCRWAEFTNTSDSESDGWR